MPLGQRRMAPDLSRVAVFRPAKSGPVGNLLPTAVVNHRGTTPPYRAAAACGCAPAVPPTAPTGQAVSGGRPNTAPFHSPADPQPASAGAPETAPSPAAAAQRFPPLPPPPSIAPPCAALLFLANRAGPPRCGRSGGGEGVGPPRHLPQLGEDSASGASDRLPEAHRAPLGALLRPTPWRARLPTVTPGCGSSQARSALADGVGNTSTTCRFSRSTTMVPKLFPPTHPHPRLASPGGAPLSWQRLGPGAAGYDDGRTHRADSAGAGRDNRPAAGPPGSGLPSAGWLAGHHARPHKPVAP